MPGDIISALSDGEFMSLVTRFPSGNQVQAMVGIRGHTLYPLNLPNVASHVIAHELGHTLGLRHNDDRTMLMCGRPAPCRPDAFHSVVERFVPITAEDKTVWLRRYPPTWKGTQWLVIEDGQW